MPEKKYLVLLAGPPGSGKTTIANNLSLYTNIKCIETGKILREKAQHEGSEAQKLKRTMEKGNFIPDQTVQDYIRESFRNNEAEEVIFLEGFPRKPTQIKGLMEILKGNNLEVTAIVKLIIEREKAYKRVTGRMICPNCTKLYNIHYSPPKKQKVCDSCSSRLVYRNDDNPQNFQKRMLRYEKFGKKTVSLLKNEYEDIYLEIKADLTVESIRNTIKEFLKERGVILKKDLIGGQTMGQNKRLYPHVEKSKEKLQ